MYETIKSIIEMGDYDLSWIILNIKKNCSRGDLSNEQEGELIQLAQEKANVSFEEKEKIEELDKRLVELEKRVSLIEQGEPQEPPVEEDYPEYVVGKWYYKDDKITFNGENYICIAPEGQVCVWSPSEYPTYWQKNEA